MQMLSGMLLPLSLLEMEPSKLAAVFIPVFSGVFVAVFLPMIIRSRMQRENGQRDKPRNDHPRNPRGGR